MSTWEQLKATVQMLKDTNRISTKAVGYGAKTRVTVMGEVPDVDTYIEYMDAQYRDLNGASFNPYRGNKIHEVILGPFKIADYEYYPEVGD